MTSAQELLAQVKANLILEHNYDDQLLLALIENAIGYAEDYQHLPPGHYNGNDMSPATRQAIIMLTSHFYESRDGSTAGFWGDNPGAAQAVWDAVNRLLILDREWKV